METCGNCGGNEQLWKLCAASKPMGLGNSLGLLADVKLCLKTLGNLDPSLLLTMIFIDFSTDFHHFSGGNLWVISPSVLLG